VPDSDNVSRRIGRRGVNKAQAFFEENNMIFQEVHQENDNGRDAFLALSWSGPDAGLIVWLQIKGGAKYKVKTRPNRLRDMDPETSLRWPRIANEGRHIIGITPRLRQLWSYSRPIFVLVQDPVPDDGGDGELYFGNLARMADLAMPRENRIPLYPDLRLTPNGLDRFLEAAKAEALTPLPPLSYSGGAVPTMVRYQDGTLGPSPITLDVMRRMEIQSPPNP
jgi:hypothetical protein